MQRKRNCFKSKRCCNLSISKDWHTLRHSQPISLLVLAFDRGFWFSFIHTPTKYVKRVVKWHNFNTCFHWNKTAGTLFPGRSWWWAVTEQLLSVPRKAKLWSWQLPPVGLACLFCDYISLLGLEQLAGINLMDVFTLLVFHLHPDYHTHLLTPPSLKRGQRQLLPCSLIVNNKRHWMGSLLTTLC